MLASAGAREVLVISNGAVPWPALRESLGGKYVRLASAKPGAPVSGFLSGEAADALLKAAGQDGAALREAAKSPDYKGAALPVTADFTAGSSVRSEEHTSELQSLMRISYAVFCLKKKTKNKTIKDKTRE